MAVAEEQSDEGFRDESAAAGGSAAVTLMSKSARFISCPSGLRGCPPPTRFASSARTAPQNPIRRGSSVGTSVTVNGAWAAAGKATIRNTGISHHRRAPGAELSFSAAASRS